MGEEKKLERRKTSAVSLPKTTQNGTPTSACAAGADSADDYYGVAAGPTDPGVVGQTCIEESIA